MNQLWCIYMMDYNPAIKIYMLKLHITIWINLTNITLRKKSSCGRIYDVTILFTHIFKTCKIVCA